MSEIPLTVRGDVEDRAVEQLRRCAESGDAVAGVLCADGHVGYSQPIGGAVAYPDHISPSGVGFDIACIAAGTPVTTEDGWCAPIEDIRAGTRATCWDGERVRCADPVDGAIDRGERPVRCVVLVNGRKLVATSDHRIRTTRGWSSVDELQPGWLVGCLPFVGLPFEACAGELHLSEDPTRASMLAEKGLWPVRLDDPRFPALLRVLGHMLGDGHLALDRKACAWYSVVPADIEAIAADLRTLG